ncbi:MAG: NADH-quinone oxidoreductase subunit L [Pseudohongiellaceae bacterium]|nr:NADH-quinone oxidoreductase subunit L [Pseudohongiellaceae bacterium]
MSELLNGWLLPALYASGFMLALVLKRNHWLTARGTALLGLIVTIILVSSAVILTQLQPLSVDKLGLTLAGLVSLLGWVIINYSARYLQGEANQTLFVRAMLFTLACVSLLAVSRHLAVIVLAWSGTSVGLHYLLTYYRERKAAQIVAHKKFIVSRLAEICLLVALVLIYQSTGTLTLDGIQLFLSDAQSLPTAMHWAAALFALAAILKSAQLPLHGWLIQVMEAPTPVSALLHAGVVNMGGFILIRLADLITLAPVAQIMLVVTGSISAVLAGLVMMTRISIKVRLAWSTCAQMGFMLMEIGLGLYELALLHLVAHSLYKAHAFLGSGDTVAQARISDFLAVSKQSRSILWYLGAFVLSAATVIGSVLLWQYFVPKLSLSAAAIAIVIMGLSPLLWLEHGSSAGLLGRGLLRIVAITQLYLLWHLLFSELVPAADTANTMLLVWVGACFALLYTGQVWLPKHPHSRLTQIVYPWAYCGFYLDETFTRFAFKFWPALLSKAQAQTLVNRQHDLVGEIA